MYMRLLIYKVGTYLLQSYHFELAHTLARYTQFFPDFQQCAAPAIADTVAQGNDRTFTRSQQGKYSLQFFSKEMLCGGFSRSRSCSIFKRVGERVAGFIVYRRIKRNRLLNYAEQIDNLGQLHIAGLSYLLRQGLQSILLRKL